MMEEFLFDPHTHTAETSKCGHLPAAEVVDRHLVGGHVIEEYTLASADIK